MTIENLKKYILDEGLVPKILEELGCHSIKVQNNYIRAANPDGDNASAITCYTDSEYLQVKNWTRDMGEGAQDIIDLVQYIRKCDFIDALKWLHATCGLKFSYYTKSRVINQEDPFLRLKRLRILKQNISDIRPLDESVLGEFTNIEWIGLFREGVTPQSCARFGVMYSYKWKRIIFPHRYALDGTLLGYNGRTTIENYEEFGIPKFFITPGYQKGDNVYGLWENRKSIEKAGLCIVVEAEKSVLKRHSLLDERFCAVTGKEITNEQKRILVGVNVPEIVISFDQDVKEEKIWAACEKFYPYKIVSYTKDNWNLLNNKQSIADLEDKKCKFLIKHRTRYDEETHNKYLRLQERRRNEVIRRRTAKGQG